MGWGAAVHASSVHQGTGNIIRRTCSGYVCNYSVRTGPNGPIFEAQIRLKYASHCLSRSSKCWMSVLWCCAVSCYRRRRSLKTLHGDLHDRTSRRPAFKAQRYARVEARNAGITSSVPWNSMTHAGTYRGPHVRYYKGPGCLGSIDRSIVKASSVRGATIAVQRYRSIALKQ